MRFTDLMLKTLPAPERGSKVYADDTLEGFGVRVSQGGTRAYVLTFGADRRRVTIGRVGVISLQDARSAAKRLLAERTLGKHLPGRVRASDALERFLEAQAEKNRKITVQGTTWLLKKHFKGLWVKNLSDITSDDITRVTDKLMKAGQPSAANHATTAIKTFFRWCVTQRKYLPHSPLEGLQLPARTISRDRVLAPDELKAIWDACEDTAFGTTVKLLILTGCRRTEIRHLTLESDLATLPAEYSKNKQAHTVPLPTLAIPLMAKDRTCSGWSKLKAALDKRCKVEEWVLHDLRRTYATTHAQLGTPPHIIEALLNHKTGIVSGVAATYNRYQYVDEMRQAVEKYEAWFVASVV